MPFTHVLIWSFHKRFTEWLCLPENALCGEDTPGSQGPRSEEAHGLLEETEQ